MRSRRLVRPPELSGLQLMPRGRLRLWLTVARAVPRSGWCACRTVFACGARPHTSLLVSPLGTFQRAVAVRLWSRLWGPVCATPVCPAHLRRRSSLLPWVRCRRQHRRPRLFRLVVRRSLELRWRSRCVWWRVLRRPWRRRRPFQMTMGSWSMPSTLRWRLSLGCRRPSRLRQKICARFAESMQPRRLNGGRTGSRWRLGSRVVLVAPSDPYYYLTYS
jgi:hypothetical protein